MDDLNRTTNRLRRKFDATANYLETKVQMEQVMDSARRVNQVVGKGSNDGQAQRLWTALRASINDLARCLQPDPHGRIESANRFSYGSSWFVCCPFG